MKQTSFLWLFLLLFWACEDPATSNHSTNSTAPPPPDKTAETARPEAKAPENHNCTVKGELLEDNDCYLRDAQLLVCILADSTTQDMDFGESHRILEVYDTKDCSLLSREALPVNNSPDFPYYLTTKTYEPKLQVICTQGFEYTFCYDVANRKMLPRLEGKFLNERLSEDAQSGMPQGLAVWGSHLFAHAQDYGAYAFDLSNKAAVKAVLPTAEWALPDREAEYHSLFLVKEGTDRYQALIPNLDEEEISLKLRTLFKEARKIDPVLSKSVRNNRFLIFKELDTNQGLAIDMQKMILVDLPADVAGQKNSEILQWLRKNG